MPNFTSFSHSGNSAVTLSSRTLNLAEISAPETVEWKPENQNGNVFTFRADIYGSGISDQFARLTVSISRPNGARTVNRVVRVVTVPIVKTIEGVSRVIDTVRIKNEFTVGKTVSLDMVALAEKISMLALDQSALVAGNLESYY